VGPRAPSPRQSNLDVGRTHRLVTPAIWRALVCRDVHCAFPGCTRPPVMGHAHHIIHWLYNGITALDNLVLLCGHHDRTIHHTPWQVRLNPQDGRPEFLPPPKPADHHPPGSDTDHDTNDQSAASRSRSSAFACTRPASHSMAPTSVTSSRPVRRCHHRIARLRIHGPWSGWRS
jgi:hypothetical protein